MIPAWKVKREWKRFQMQLLQWHWFVFGGLRRRRYDRARAEAITVTEGGRGLAEDAAILLIYQPKGLLPSLLAELDYLWSKGIAPIVVSNAPIPAADLARLAPHCHLVLQRPNYGYDFGGYRDGVLTLLERGIRPKSLFVMNDSIWFPLTADSRLIDQARDSEADLFGIFYNERPKEPHRSHLQSYFYRFGPRLVGSPAFETYWRKLTLTNNKYMVIRQCEMKLTHAFRTQGFSVAHLYDMAAMRAGILALSDAELHDMLRYQAVVDTRSARYVEPLIAAGPAAPGWRAGVEALVREGRIGRYFLNLHPLVLLREMGAPVLKKDRQPMYQLQRKELVRTGLDQGFLPALREEIVHWDDAAGVGPNAG